MKELINVAKNIKAPAIYAFLKDPYCDNTEGAMQARGPRYMI